MKQYDDLEVRQLGYELALLVYRLTAGYPDEERCGLTRRIRRAGVSVPGHIAEGCDRGADRELARSCDIGSGPAAEVDSYGLLSRDLGYLEEPAFQHLRAKTRALRSKLNGLSSYLRGA